MEKLLTKTECAEMLHVSPRTIDTMRVERGLPYLTMQGTRRILFDQEQVRNWLQSVNTDNEKKEQSNG